MLKKSPQQQRGETTIKSPMAEWRSRMQLQLNAIHRPRFKSPSQLIPITNSTNLRAIILTRPWKQMPMLKSPPSSSVGRDDYSRVQCRVAEQEAASIEGHTQA
ncbi:unnamed protein product [Staurois parvus]|uniref:Uncharacterized protein n=1 Tax=Staurois parvus TaxID=386267 RepID=A0ABN9GCX5_9NEOB|nr:unnamed protein product [Staurois parvus]